MTKKAHAIKSLGARVERAAMRTRLRRRIRQFEEQGKPLEANALREEIDWVLARQRRYDVRPGGLGRR
ncbi:MAG: hypothetical protein QN174_07690 [Armatimonadota bacterium]|nr:hypothetical protein [Armatimonadota bacterium]